ncbi:hypothetical protein HKX48_009022 [Thoreauomyces humboldtii]|nr:hypothetical protein HKX48_009022 [Thoreauomyces humboldtii]
MSVALINGASRGIGLALAHRFLNQTSLSVVTTARGPKGSLPTAALDDEQQSRWTHIGECDLTSEENVKEAARRLQANFGPDSLACVVNVAGYLKPEKTIRTIDVVELQRHFEINTFAATIAAKHLSPLLFNPARQGSPLRPFERPVWASVSARTGSIGDNRLGGWYSYRMSKAALNMLTKCLAVELGSKSNKDGIVVSIHPGTVKTELSRAFISNVAHSSLFTTDEAAQKMFDVLIGLKKADNGRFMDYANKDIVWARAKNAATLPTPFQRSVLNEPDWGKPVVWVGPGIQALDQASFGALTTICARGPPSLALHIPAWACVLVARVSHFDHWGGDGEEDAFTVFYPGISTALTFPTAKLPEKHHFRRVISRILITSFYEIKTSGLASLLPSSALTRKAGSDLSRVALNGKDAAGTFKNFKKNAWDTRAAAFKKSMSEMDLIATDSLMLKDLETTSLYYIFRCLGCGGLSRSFRDGLRHVPSEQSGMSIENVRLNMLEFCNQGIKATIAARVPSDNVGLLECQKMLGALWEAMALDWTNEERSPNSSSEDTDNLRNKLFDELDKDSPKPILAPRVRAAYMKAASLYRTVSNVSTGPGAMLKSTEKVYETIINARNPLPPTEILVPALVNLRIAYSANKKETKAQETQQMIENLTGDRDLQLPDIGGMNLGLWMSVASYIKGAEEAYGKICANNACRKIEWTKSVSDMPPEIADSDQYHLGHMKKCASCKIAVYCSKDCQKSHWPLHKEQCGPLMEAGSNVHQLKKEARSARLMGTSTSELAADHTFLQAIHAWLEDGIQSTNEELKEIGTFHLNRQPDSVVPSDSLEKCMARWMQCDPETFRILLKTVKDAREQLAKRQRART